MVEDTARKVLLRISAEQLAEVDERRAEVGLSRNAWLLKALAWALDQPIKTTTVNVKTGV